MLEPSELFPEVPNLYEFPSIHSDMIYDERRVGAYQKAIEQTVRPGDVVMDVGTGTGILAFLSLRAGAKHVHAVDRSPVIEWAKELAAANGFSDKITFHNYDSRDVNLPEKVDVIVSELIGHIAFEEGMVESLSHAKKHFLKPGGVMIPKTVSLLASPVCEKKIYRECIDQWQPKYGLNYSIMRSKALETSYITDIAEEDLFAKPQAVFSADFEEGPDVSFKSGVERFFEISRDGEVNGLAFWFNSDLSEFVPLSSSPWSKTHWKQCFTPFAAPRTVKANETLRVRFDMVLCEHRTDKFTLTATIID